MRQRPGSGTDVFHEVHANVAQAVERQVGAGRPGRAGGRGRSSSPTWCGRGTRGKTSSLAQPRAGLAPAAAGPASPAALPSRHNPKTVTLWSLHAAWLPCWGQPPSGSKGLAKGHLQAPDMRNACLKLFIVGVTFFRQHETRAVGTCSASRVVRVRSWCWTSGPSLAEWSKSARRDSRRSCWAEKAGFTGGVVLPQSAAPCSAPSQARRVYSELVLKMMRLAMAPGVDTLQAQHGPMAAHPSLAASMVVPKVALEYELMAYGGMHWERRHLGQAWQAASSIHPANVVQRHAC